MPEKEGFPMPKDLFQKIDDAGHTGGTKGSIQQIILIVLLLLTAALGYLYFFTGLIKPREQITEAPLSKDAPVKQPLPPRPDQGGLEQPSAEKPAEKQSAPATAEKAATPPASSQTKPAVTPPTKPVVTSAPIPTAAPTLKPVVDSTPKPAATSLPKQAPSNPQAAKTVKAAKKPVAKLHAKSPAAQAAPSSKPLKKSKPKPVAVAAGKEEGIAKPAVPVKRTAIKGVYTLLAGEFVSERETKNARLKLEKQGITNFHVRKIIKSESMHRLFLADFDSHDAADTELRKLRPNTNSAFIMNENGRYAVYAGSYLHERGAAAEQKRLARKGVKLTLKMVKVSLPINELTAGSFPGGEDAKKEANRLKKKGIVVRVIKSGQ